MDPVPQLPSPVSVFLSPKLVKPRTLTLLVALAVTQVL